MSGTGQESTQRTIERVARESYGRLVAYLSSHTRDVASAEDALSNALVAALVTWPRDGVPQNPEAWLLTAARHSLIDLVRHQQVAAASEPTLLLLREEPMPVLALQQAEGFFGAQLGDSGEVLHPEAIQNLGAGEFAL